MKKFLALLLALMMVLSLCACGAKEEAPAEEPAAEEPVAEEPAAEEAPAAEGSVYWLNFKPESDEALKEIAAMYTEETGVPVEIVTAASGTYEETLTAEMDKSNPPTIFVVGKTEALKTWGEYCLDLAGTDLDKEMTGDYRLYDADGKLCALGYTYECYGIIVNTALLEEAGYTIDDINNFETLKTVAEDIHGRADELGFDAFSACGMDDSSNWRFTGHLINLEYYYESVDNPDNWAEQPTAIEGTYMDNYKALYDLMVTNSTVDRAELANGGFDAAAEFKAGEAVFYVNGNWEWAGLSDAGMDAANLTMIPYYCGVEGEEKAGLNCGTENYWAVNANADEADIQATLDFLYWLVTDEEAAELAVGTFSVMPYAQTPASTNPFLAVANDYAAAGNYTMPWVTNYQPLDPGYRATAVSALNQYNADPTDANWDLVEAAFIAGWATYFE